MLIFIHQPCLLFTKKFEQTYASLTVACTRLCLKSKLQKHIDSVTQLTYLLLIKQKERNQNVENPEERVSILLLRSLLHNVQRSYHSTQNPTKAATKMNTAKTNIQKGHSNVQHEKEKERELKLQQQLPFPESKHNCSDLDEQLDKHRCLQGCKRLCCCLRQMRRCSLKQEGFQVQSRTVWENHVHS